MAVGSTFGVVVGDGSPVVTVDDSVGDSVGGSPPPSPAELLAPPGPDVVLDEALGEPDIVLETPSLTVEDVELTA